MNKRVDFSLGMRGAAANDAFAGDVYADRDPDRARVNIIEASRDRSRESQDRSRTSADTARTTSHEHNLGPGGLARRNTADTRWRRSPSVVHRNRFFGRHNVGDDSSIAEQGLADVPEEQGRNNGGNSGGRIDPRTGMVSPRAFRMSTDESRSHAAVSGALGFDTGDTDAAPAGHQPLSAARRAHTDTYEMRRMNL